MYVPQQVFDQNEACLWEPKLLVDLPQKNEKEKK